MFLDEATISVRGGTGGRGCVSWRREKYVPRGGPDGGDGGKGGSIIFIADENTDTLSDFISKKRFEAEKGAFGSGKNRRGKDGGGLTLRVPPGTLVWDAEPGTTVSLLADLHHPGDQFIVAEGGRGGYGNAHFLSSTRQRPDFAELGEPGQSRTVKLELKLVADAGIIGYPSVGKSTLISVISAARPKIADYPFTTLIPNLGVVTAGDRSFVVCDVPGLIEGASEGKGLGDKFLRHIERCGVLLHVLDISRALREGGLVETNALVQDYNAIRHELEAYSPALTKKRELVILNKIDLLGGDATAVRRDLAAAGIEVFHAISAATKHGTAELVQMLLPLILEEREHRVIEATEKDTDVLPVLKPQEASRHMGAFRIEERADGAIVVRGKRIEQFAVMTDFESRGAVERFRDVVERIGLLKALDRAGRKEDTPVFIGEKRVDEYL